MARRSRISSPSTKNVKTDLSRTTFGISNEIIRDLHANSKRDLAAAREAENQQDYPAFADATDSLLAMQSQEYQTLSNTTNGIIHGVIFLLLGVIPFSYFLERLLVGSPNVYKQIGWFAFFFVLMTASDLWFHPAFRISTSPLMILLAFFILILSSTVVYILWGKFEEEIKRLRGTSGDTAHIQSFQRGAVLGASIPSGPLQHARRAVRNNPHSHHSDSSHLHPALLYQRARVGAGFPQCCLLFLHPRRTAARHLHPPHLRSRLGRIAPEALQQRPAASHSTA